MMKKTLLLVLSLLCLSAMGGNVSPERAKALGEKFVGANFKLASDLQWVCTAETAKGNPSYHVFNVLDGGFVIVSACDLTSPILGYSKTGHFNLNRIPDGLQYLLDGYGQSVDFAEERLTKASPEITQEWESLEQRGKLQAVKSTVSPLVATRWDQDCYYNAYCPKDTEGPCGCAYAGCVATTMAQIMKYWNHPQQGTGNHSYNSILYGTLSVDFGATTYHWDAMPESLSTHNNAVAELIYHCGVSVDMNYSAYASGALQASIPSAMSSYFGYGPSHCLERDNYTYEAWTALMRDALDAGLPIAYSGTPGPGGTGHSFICDGYDANGLFHINWSWGGELDGWFSIDNLHTYNQNWNYYQKMVADLRPSPVYNQTPKPPTNLSVTPLGTDSYNYTMSWTNPSKTLNNSNLQHIDQIIVKCNGQVIYSANNVTPGATMEITGEVSFYGVHEFQVYAVNNGCHGEVARTDGVHFGPACAWTITTTAFNGWQGAAILVYNNANQVWATVSPTSGQQTLNVDIPFGNIGFSWNQGDSNLNTVSFVIKDSENNAVYTYSGPTADLPTGRFFETNNDCGNDGSCASPTDLYAEAVDDQIVLNWTSDAIATDFNIYRDGSVIFTLRDHTTTFVDTTATHGGHCYAVTAFCTSGEGDPTNEACATIGIDCQPPTSLWYEMTSTNKVKLLWNRPEPSEGLSKFYVYRTKESEMAWTKIATTNAGATSVVDTNPLEDENFYLYKVVAYYQAIDCQSSPARSRYNELEYFLRVYWSVDGITEEENAHTEVFPIPGTDRLNIRTVAPEATIQIFDIFGRKMLEAQLNEEITVVDTEAWPAGVYVWKVYTGVSTGSTTLAETGKWIKE